MKSFGKLYKESPAITAIAMMAQDYVLFDEECYANQKIKKNFQNQNFWLDISQNIFNTVSDLIAKKNRDDSDDIDEQDIQISDKMVYNYILNAENRFYLNDIICEAVENWISFH